MTQYYLTPSPSGIGLIPKEQMPVKPEDWTDDDGFLASLSSFLYVKKMKEYTEAIKQVIAASIPVSDIEKAKDHMAKLRIELGSDACVFASAELGSVYGPFIGEYEIRRQYRTHRCNSVSEWQYEEFKDNLFPVEIREVAILSEPAQEPVKESQVATISVHKSLIPKNSELVEAYETTHRIIVMFQPGEEIPENHDCDQTGCGSFSHVKYIFTKPD